MSDAERERVVKAHTWIRLHPEFKLGGQDARGVYFEDEHGIDRMMDWETVEEELVSAGEVSFAPQTGADAMEFLRQMRGGSL